MTLLLFAVLGGYIGWKLGPRACSRVGRLPLASNILIGTIGALVSEWLVVRIVGESAQLNLTVSASLASLGAIVSLVGVELLRQFRHAPKSRAGWH
jgi:uncharacterized membrane protein YeaQ/YmgE (transglycosylase-associated protein family)